MNSVFLSPFFSLPCRIYFLPLRTSLRQKVYGEENISEVGSFYLSIYLFCSHCRKESWRVFSLCPYPRFSPSPKCRISPFLSNHLCFLPPSLFSSPSFLSATHHPCPNFSLLFYYCPIQLFPPSNMHPTEPFIPLL